MSSPLLVLWSKLFTDDDKKGPRRGVEQTRLPDMRGQRGSAGILLVLRRMRIPLIVLIVIFAVSVLGLSLMPGQDAEGHPRRMGLFESFYFMSYTATTIGFGELPYTFTPAQRMWVTFAIFLSVIGWAYAVGSLLSLMQDRAFRRALARRHYASKVSSMGEPFLLLVGYGYATRMLARSLDDMGRRFAVVDDDENRLTSVELASYRADTPALLADVSDTAKMVLAGLGYRHCEGVVAMTGDDEINLDVVMTTALLRPDLPVIARSNSRDVAERMRAFGAPEVVNPLDRFGDHLRIVMRSPASYQLMMWLTSAPGTPLPPRRAPLPRGRWVVCGYGRIGRELTADLRREGIAVTVAVAVGTTEENDDQGEAVALDAADLEHADAVVAATDSDTTNLWLVERARRANADAFIVAMQNRAANSPLFQAVGVDFGLVPAAVLAHEVLARLANPMLMRFLPEVPRQDEGWAAHMVERLVDRCGTRTPDLWRIRLTQEEAPALRGLLAAGDVMLGDLLRRPHAREETIDAVPLGLLRDGSSVLAPEDDLVLQQDDDLLIAGRPAARQALDATLNDGPTATYVVTGRYVPAGWLWRHVTQRGDGRPEQRV